MSTITAFALGFGVALLLCFGLLLWAGVRQLRQARAKQQRSTGANSTVRHKEKAIAILNPGTPRRKVIEGADDEWVN